MARITLALLLLVAPLGAPALAARAQEANRRLVLDFWRVVIEAHDADRVADFCAPDVVQHNPNIADGAAALAAFLRERWRGQDKPPLAARLHNPPVVSLADGDLVQLVFREPTPDPMAPGRSYDRYLFDLYRVKDGRIVEHWDAVTKRAP